MPIQTRKESNLDEARCFALWYERGTLRKAASVLAQEGIINPVTQRPYSYMSVYNAAMRWVFDYPEEAWEYWKTAGTDLTKLQWEEWLVRTAVIQIYKYSRRGFFRWIRKNGYERYEYIYVKITGRFDPSQEISI